MCFESTHGSNVSNWPQFLSLYNQMLNYLGMTMLASIRINHTQSYETLCLFVRFQVSLSQGLLSAKKDAFKIRISDVTFFRIESLCDKNKNAVHYRQMFIVQNFLSQSDFIRKEIFSKIVTKKLLIQQNVQKLSIFSIVHCIFKIIG